MRILNFWIESWLLSNKIYGHSIFCCLISSCFQNILTELFAELFKCNQKCAVAVVMIIFFDALRMENNECKVVISAYSLYVVVMLTIIAQRNREREKKKHVKKFQPYSYIYLRNKMNKVSLNENENNNTSIADNNNQKRSKVRTTIAI